MKVFERLNKVQAGANFDKLMEIMEKHLDDAAMIVNKYYSPIFNKFSKPIIKPMDAYKVVAGNILGEALKESYPMDAYFSFDYGMKHSLSIIIDKKGEVELRFSTSTSEVPFDKGVKELKEVIEPLFSISKKDFDNAYKKSKAEIEKELKKWEK